MDEVDGAILREMLRSRALLWGGGDPRLGIADFAKRLGMDRTTVWARLRNWKEQGFLVRHEIVPNPSLFGAGLSMGTIRVDDPRQKRKVTAALPLVEGILAGAEQVGPYFLLLYAHASTAALDRCTRLLAELPGVDEVSTCIPFEPPQSKIEPTPTDWRILAALRRTPEAPLASVAKVAGISSRTLTRRYGDLLGANAIWWFPVLDFTKYRNAVLARFVISTDTHRSATKVINSVQREMPHALWWHMQGDEDGGPAWVELHSHLASAAQGEDVVEALLQLPGTEAVETFYPKSWFVLPTWFDERIQEQLKVA